MDGLNITNIQTLLNLNRKVPREITEQNPFKGKKETGVSPGFV